MCSGGVEVRSRTVTQEVGGSNPTGDKEEKVTTSPEMELLENRCMESSHI